jgi:hypothetical protein
MNKLCVYKAIAAIATTVVINQEEMNPDMVDNSVSLCANKFEEIIGSISLPRRRFLLSSEDTSAAFKLAASESPAAILTLEASRRSAIS